MNTSCIRNFCGLLLLGALAQANAKEPLALTDLAYDSKDKAQVLDVYRAKSDEPLPVVIYIHGGGWHAGSHKNVPAFLRKAAAEGEFAVVSVEYRFTNVAPHPAQVNDCRRAIQFVRHHAEEWGLDATRMGATGGSAGGHLSLYMGLADEAADPDAEDPVSRESTRVSCVVGWAGPTDWSLLDTIPHDHPGYRQLIGYEGKTKSMEMDAAKKASVSPITFASEDDPPILIVHGSEDVIVPFQHAKVLHTRLLEVGGKTELLTIEGGRHGVAGASDPKAVERAMAFFNEHLELP